MRFGWRRRPGDGLAYAGRVVFYAVGRGHSALVTEPLSRITVRVETSLFKSNIRQSVEHDGSIVHCRCKTVASLHSRRTVIVQSSDPVGRAIGFQAPVHLDPAPIITRVLIGVDDRGPGRRATASDRNVRATAGNNVERLT